MLISAFNVVDVLVLGLVLQELKVDLSLSDTQLGVLTGIAFAFFYSVMGIPLARWADRGNRVRVISTTTALWSVGVALCAVAGNFWQLVSIRAGVAIGEAGCGPPAHSLIAEYFTREQRPRAVAVYMLGSPLSYLIGYFVAGWLDQLYGWRMTFVLVGLPGLGLAALSHFTLREPRAKQSRAASEDSPGFGETCVTLWNNRTFRHLLLCFSVLYFFGSGIGSWQPTFFVRSFGLRTRELGAWLAVILGLGGMLGIYLGGQWASRKAGGNERLQLEVMSIAYVCFGLVMAGVYVSGNLYLSLALLGIASVGANSAMGPLFATVQTLVPPRMRAMSIAIVFLFANLIGAGLGPLAVGTLSDAFRPWAGEESLRYALLALSPGYTWAAWHCWRARLTVAADIAAASEASQLDKNVRRAPTTSSCG